jgi:hypothetical protein
MRSAPRNRCQGLPWAAAESYEPLAGPVPRVPGFIGLGKIGCGFGAGWGEGVLGAAMATPCYAAVATSISQIATSATRAMTATRNAHRSGRRR